MFTLTVSVSPVAVPASPLKVGVVSCVLRPSAGAVSDTNGPVVSTVKEWASLKPVLAPLSSCSARAV